MDLAIILKTLAPLASKGAAAVAPSLFRSWIVAFTAYWEVKKRGHRVGYFSLRSVIVKHQVFDVFNRRSEAEISALAPILSERVENPGPTTGEELLAILARAYVNSLPPAQAARTEGESTREHVSHEVSTLRDGFESQRDFETNLSRLNPLRVVEAQRLNMTWSELPRVVAAIAAAEDKSQVFSDWAEHPPEWLVTAPASVACWLATVALDYGNGESGRQLLDTALAAGATPRDYWIAKSAWMFQHNSKEDAEERLRPALSHPLASALWYDLQGDQDLAISTLESWDPSSQADLATKSLILAQLMAVKDPERATAAAVAGYESYECSDCALFAARLLVRRGASRLRPRFLSDLNQGLKLANEARDSRRRWGGDSAAAVLVAITAYRTLGSPEEAWRTGRAAPDGTATESEASDPRVISALARTAADLGMTERARELVPLLADGPEKMFAAARLVEAESGFDAAASLWVDLLAATTDPEDALNIGFRLAHFGRVIEWPQWVSTDYPADVADINLISELFREVEEALPKARIRSATSPQVFHGLMTFLLKKQNLSAAAALAEESGRRRSDPEAWLRAAEIHLSNDDHASAANAAEQAVRVGGTEWLREPDARKLLIEVHGNHGRWDQALIEAGRLLEIRQDDAAAKWAFITGQLMTGDYQGAWESYNGLGKPTPTTSDTARVWIHLHAQFSSALNHLDEAERIVQRWPENEQLRANMLSSILLSDAKLPTEKQIAQIRALRDSFFTDFPDSTHARAITVDENNPIEALTEILGQVADRDEALLPVFAGELPFGMISEATGKSYAEICLVRGAGKLFAGNPHTWEAEVQAALDSFNERVVFDTTSLATLAVLGDSAKDWPGYFAAGIVPVSSIHDAQRAAAGLSSLSTATIGVDRASGRPRISQITADEAQTRFDRANALLDSITKLTAVSHPEIISLPEIDANGENFSWLLPLDFAKSQAIPFWCDDRILRSLASGLEVPAFGTFAVLEALLRNGRITNEAKQIAEAQLIHNYYVGGSFAPQVMELAAEMDGWLPLGIAACISETGPTSSPENQIGLALQALGHCAHNPEAIHGWVAAVAKWLTSVSPDAATAHENLHYWFSTILEQQWLDSSSLPHVLEGLQAASSDKVDLERIVPTVIGHFYDQIASKIPPAIAADYVKELVSLAPAKDKSSVLRHIISI